MLVVHLSLNDPTLKDSTRVLVDWPMYLHVATRHVKEYACARVSDRGQSMRGIGAQERDVREGLLVVPVCSTLAFYHYMTDYLFLGLSQVWYVAVQVYVNPFHLHLGRSHPPEPLCPLSSGNPHPTLPSWHRALPLPPQYPREERWWHLHKVGGW